MRTLNGTGTIRKVLRAQVGAAVAVEAADVALFTNDLQALASIVRLGRMARNKIYQNIVFSVIVKVCRLCFCKGYVMHSPLAGFSNQSHILHNH